MTPAQFARRMQELGATVESNVDGIVRKAARAIDAAVVMATPVDTGRARGNWQVSVDAPIVTTSENVDPSGGSVIAEGDAIISTYGPGNSSIHITNNLSYIGRLNEGHSPQAPAGFIQSAVQIGVNAIQNSRILDRRTVD